jgi:hypothetical protein
VPLDFSREEVNLMVKYNLRYARYALSALSAVGFVACKST